MLKFIILAFFLATAARASRLQIIGGNEVDAPGESSFPCSFQFAVHSDLFQAVIELVQVQTSQSELSATASIHLYNSRFLN